MMGLLNPGHEIINAQVIGSASTLGPDWRVHMPYIYAYTCESLILIYFIWSGLLGAHKISISSFYRRQTKENFCNRRSVCTIDKY